MNANTEAPTTEGAQAAGAKHAEGEAEAGPPPWGTVFRAQLRLLLRKKWKLLVFLALAIGLPTVGLFRAVTLAGAELTPDLAPGLAAYSLETVAMSPPVYGLAGLLALAWAASVWSDEGPGERAYHWSLPVRRPVHDLTRAGGGALLFLAASALGLSVAFVAHLLLGGRFALGDAAVWGVIVLGIVVSYLLGTIPALVSAHPFRWVIGTVLGYVFLGGLLEVSAERWSWLAGLEGAVKSVWNGAYGLEAALHAPLVVSLSPRVGESFSPGPRGGVLALFLWIVLAAAAVVGVSFLHLERAKGAAE